MNSKTTVRRDRRSSWLAAALVGWLCAQITGYTTPPPSTVPEGSAAMKAQALCFTPPPGQAGVYVIRPYEFHADSYYGEHFGNNANIRVGLDYQEFGSLATNSYLFGLVPPGKHALGSSDLDMLDSRSLSAPFTAEAGKNYFFTATGRANSIHTDIHVNPISETEGQGYVRQFKLSGENRFEFQKQAGQAK